MTLRQRLSSLSDKTLDRILRAAVVALVVGALAFAGVYYQGQHVDKGPSLVSRQISSAEQAVRAAPRDVSARLRLASAYRMAKRYDPALKQYDEILKAVPDLREALLGKGGVLMAKNDLDAAKATFRKITGVAVKGEFAGADTQLEQAYYYLGSIAMTQGAPAEAATDLQAALKIDKTDADAWYLLGTAQLKQGAAQQAAESVRRALLFVPTDWCDPYVTLGTAYRKLGNAPQASYADAMLAFCNKQPDDAARQLNALLSGPASVDAMLGLGMIADKASRKDEAISWYRKVLAKDPTNTSALYALSSLGGGAAKPSGTPHANTGLSAGEGTN